MPALKIITLRSRSVHCDYTIGVVVCGEEARVLQQFAAIAREKNIAFFFHPSVCLGRLLLLLSQLFPLDLPLSSSAATHHDVGWLLMTRSDEVLEHCRVHAQMDAIALMFLVIV